MGVCRVCSFRVDPPLVSVVAAVLHAFCHWYGQFRVSGVGDKPEGGSRWWLLDELGDCEAQPEELFRTKVDVLRRKAKLSGHYVANWCGPDLSPAVLSRMSKASISCIVPQACSPSCPLVSVLSAQRVAHCSGPYPPSGRPLV